MSGRREFGGGVCEVYKEVFERGLIAGQLVETDVMVKGDLSHRGTGDAGDGQPVPLPDGGDISTGEVAR